MASRLADPMSLFSDAIGLSLSFLSEATPGTQWVMVGAVVDVGGSKGSQSVVVAQSFPNLHFVVQDLPDMIGGKRYTNYQR